MSNHVPSPGERSHSSDLDSARDTACHIVEDVWAVRGWAELHPDAGDDAEDRADEEIDREAYRTVRGLLYGCPELDYYLRQFGELFDGALPHIESFGGVDAPSYHATAFWLAVTVLHASEVARDRGGVLASPPDESGRRVFMTSKLRLIMKAAYKARFKKLIRVWVPSFNGRRLCAWIAKESARASQCAAQTEWTRRPPDSGWRPDALFRVAEAFLWIKSLDGDFDQAAAKLGREVQDVKGDYEVGVKLVHQVSKLLSAKQSPAIEANGSVDALQPPGGPGGQAGPVAKPKGKPGINARMLESIQQNPEAMGWKSTEWQRHLKCSRSAVVETETWQTLKSARLAAKAKRMKDRRRKPKASEERRGR